MHTYDYTIAIEDPSCSRDGACPHPAQQAQSCNGAAFSENRMGASPTPTQESQYSNHKKGHSYDKLTPVSRYSRPAGGAARAPGRPGGHGADREEAGGGAADSAGGHRHQFSRGNRWRISAAPRGGR